MSGDDTTDLDGWLKQGLHFHHQGELTKAAPYYRRVLDQDPRHLTAGSNLGALLIDLGRVLEAFDLLSEMHGFYPDDVDILNNLGNALQRLTRMEEAANLYQRAHDMAPDQPVITLNLARTRLRLGNTEEAIKLCEIVEAAHPEIGAARFLSALAMPFIARSTAQYAEMRTRTVAKVRGLIDDPPSLTDPVNEVGLTNFSAAYHGENDREIQVLIAEAYLRACPSLAFRAVHCDSYQPPVGRRIRVGFASAHLGSHTIGKYNRRMVAHLDRTHFEVFVFHLGADARDQDKDLAALAESADQFLSLPGRLEDARHAIAGTELDILYYPDIGMEPMSYFLGFARLAPLQCMTWGHPVTSGLPEMDYFISSDLLEPEDAQEHYSEKLVCFPSISASYALPVFPAHVLSRRDLGLPEDGRLYMCPQSLFKFHPSFDQLMAGILRADDQGRIILIDGQQAAWSTLLRERLTRTIGKLAERVEILPRMPGEKYLSLMHHADIILDTPIFCGGNTSLEAFAAGKVVVTLPSGFMRGKVTEALYRQMGVTGGVAQDMDDYVELAVSLARDEGKRGALEKRIVAARALIFDDDDPIRAHEAFFKETLGGLTGP